MSGHTRISGKTTRRQRIKEGWAGRLKAFTHVLHDRAVAAQAAGRGADADWNAWCAWSLWEALDIRSETKRIYMQTIQRWKRERLTATGAA